MILNEKRITLKDGREAVLRSPRADEAESLLCMIQTAWGETDFLLRSAADVGQITVESERVWIENALASPGKLVAICEVGGRIAGISEINFFSQQKIKHRAGIGITVLNEFWNVGIGSALLSQLVSAARSHGGTSIVELEFIEGNARARALYEKFGFRIVAQKPDAFKMPDGSLRAEYFMQMYI